MIFAAKYLIELPYVINLSDDDYDFKYEDSLIRMNVNNNLYALVRFVNSCQLTAAIGLKEHLLPHLTESLSLVKARTIVSFISAYEVSELESVSEQDLLNYLRRIMPMGNEYPSEEKVKETLQNLNENQKKDIINRAGIEKTANMLFPATSAMPCIDVINNFIRHYSVHFRDHFAEEISLYQAASGLTNGIMLQLFCDNDMISSIPIVGLFPPILRNTLFVHDEEKTNAFKKVLTNSHFNKQSELLLIRARNLKTKGAFRSAMLEASASLENYVRLLLIHKMKENGLSDSDIESTLTKVNKFEDRCKKLFKSNFSKSIPEIAPLEWQCVKTDRDNIRHKTTHTSHEPTEQEVGLTICNIEKLIVKVDSYLDALNKSSSN